MTVDSYIENIAKRYALGNATEHTFRGDLQQLVETLVPDIAATNEPKRIECGAPDYVITRKEIPVGYVEAKDVGKDLGSKDLKEQLDRYKQSLDNLIYTDYLEFRLYLNGELTTTLRIAEIKNGRIVPLPENFGQFESLIRDFCSRTPQTIKSSKKLAEMMADKAKMLAYIIRNALESDEASQANSTLHEQMAAFKEILIHDIDAKGFADIYSQTIAYGMFAARLHDPTLESFSRQEAAERVPKTNPFLRKLFQYIAGYDLDDRIKWIVDALADIFRASDVKAILENFGKSTQTHDPIMHFYETFLAEYDPKLRKSRGVYYTPEPVVDFIVRAVDDILKTEFNLPSGLADTSKIKIKEKVPVVKKGQGTVYEEIEKEIHKVQILDPATGTGTFLAQIIKQIHKGFANQQGVWNQYVDDHLIPRLNGFELLMASYAMAHLKLDLLLSETGYTSDKDRRFQVYLTNALEEYHPDTGTLWASWLSAEANEANHLKRDTPVMVVIGNPPYSGDSANKGDWIMSLMEDFKKEPGGKEKLKERNPKWINDDYVKFLRFGQHLIEKNGEGILAFINNHSFLDNPTFRGMRWKLMNTFDALYVVDLHGSSKKNEISPDGGRDENVFDIMQGVSVNLFVKTSHKKKKSLSRIHHFDIFGTREKKYEVLSKACIDSINFAIIEPHSPNYFMVPKDFGSQADYDEGFGIAELFVLNSVGVVTGKDKVLIAENSQDVLASVERVYEINANADYLEEINYRPFDKRLIYYDTDLVERAREKVVWHFLEVENLGLALCKQFKTGDQYVHVFISNRFIESCYVSNRTSEITSIFPLFEYYNDEFDDEFKRLGNFNGQILEKIAARVSLTFTNEKEDGADTFAALDILDYIYAVLHSPSYREKYKEFLKIDFPRVPYPKDAETFWELVRFGGELRERHLLESPKVNEIITGYPVAGDNVVTKPEYNDGSVFINSTQHFSGVPETAWNFYIGGYQPAQKWLKDRKGRTLSYEDIQHYQKIIVALTETDRLMKEIDKISIY